MPAGWWLDSAARSRSTHDEPHRVPRAEAIIAEHIAKFESWRAALEAGSIVEDLRDSFHKHRESLIREKLAEMDDVSPEERARIARITEELIEKIAIDLNGTTQVQVGDKTIDFKRPFKRITMFDSIKEFTGIDISAMDEDQLRGACRVVGHHLGDAFRNAPLHVAGVAARRTRIECFRRVLVRLGAV